MKNFIGKKISVIHPKWPKERQIGLCTFAGKNNFGHFQVTINRMPIWPVNPNEIIILDK